jgi:hypothetical protein
MYNCNEKKSISTYAKYDETNAYWLRGLFKVNFRLKNAIIFLQPVAYLKLGIFHQTRYSRFQVFRNYYSLPYCQILISDIAYDSSVCVTVFPSDFLHEMAYIVNHFGLTWPWKGHHSKNRNSLCCNLFQWCSNSSHLVLLEEKQSGR